MKKVLFIIVMLCSLGTLISFNQNAASALEKIILGPEAADLREIGLDCSRAEEWKVLQTEEDTFQNLAVNACLEGWKDDIYVSVNADGSLTLNGIHHGDDLWIGFSPAHYMLQNGDYYFSDEGFSMENDLCKVCFGGKQWSYDWFHVDNVLADPSNRHMTVDNTVYEYYWYCIHVMDGYAADNVTVRFMIYPDTEGREDYSYQPSPVLHSDEEEGMYQYLRFSVNEEDYENLSEREQRYFLNNIKYQYSKKYDWCTIDFGDRTGIQFKSENPDTPYAGSLDAADRALTG